MKKLLMAVLALQVTGTLFAQDEHLSLNDKYVGYEAGLGKAKIPSNVDGQSLSKFDTTFYNSRFFLGKSFNDSLAVEAGYFVGGQFAANLTDSQVQVAGSFNLYDISLISRPFSNKQFFLTGGMTYGEEIIGDARSTGWGTTAGLGYEIPIYSNALRFTYRKYISPSRESNNFSSYNIGLVIPFDEKNSNKFQDSSNGKLSVGLMYSFMAYEEPSIDVKSTGRLNGILFDYDFDKYDASSTKLEARYSQGLSNYSSPDSGNSSGNANNLLEIRLTKKDLLSKLNLNFPEFYSGIGYRKYDNDARGLSSGLASGYRRTSQYIYIPFGIEKHIVLNNQKVIAKAEYDFFVSGRQKSYLSDAQIDGEPDINNKQTSGYGVRGSLSFEKYGWKFVPFFEYWSIGDSEIVDSIFEPKNSTKEIGLRVFNSF
jgi:hypothetical protein